MSPNCRFFIFFGLLSMVTIGCTQHDRPELASVSVTVTLDGQPLELAAVLFRPSEGRASRGFTDAEGRFELIYLRDIQGATLGNHQVSITTRTEMNPEERVPEKYNVRTTLTREVAEKHNEFEFSLESN